MAQFTAQQVAELVAGELRGDPAVVIDGVASLEEATPTDLSFLGNPRYLSQVLPSRAGIVLVPPDFSPEPPAGRAWVVCASASSAFAALIDVFAPPAIVFAPGCHATAVIADSAQLAADVHVGANAVIEDEVSIGQGTIIAPGCYVGHHTKIGAGCWLHPNVTVLHRCTLGDRVILHSGVVIGSDGFGYINTPERHIKLPQVGTVQIDDEVEIGAGTTIDRARFDRTWIKRGAIIDNLVQIGHNVVVGELAIIVAQCGLAGSSEVGRGAIMAGQSAIPGHLKLGDGAVLMGKTGPIKDVPAGQQMMGVPAVPRLQFMKQQAALKRLPDLLLRVRELERQLAALQS